MCARVKIATSNASTVSTHQQKSAPLRTTTDNGSNFLKFVVRTKKPHNEVCGDAEPGEKDLEEEEEEEVEFVNLSLILNEDDGSEFYLPKHQQCACHLLNFSIVSTVDAAKATANNTYTKSVLFNIQQVSCIVE